MALKTRGGKLTINSPMPSSVENMIRSDDEVEDVSCELEDKTGQEAEVPEKVTIMPRLPPPLPHRLV